MIILCDILHNKESIGFSEYVHWHGYGNRDDTIAPKDLSHILNREYQYIASKYSYFFNDMPTFFEDILSTTF